MDWNLTLMASIHCLLINGMASLSRRIPFHSHWNSATCWSIRTFCDDDTFFKMCHWQWHIAWRNVEIVKGRFISNLNCEFIIPSMYRVYSYAWGSRSPHFCSQLYTTGTRFCHARIFSIQPSPPPHTNTSPPPTSCPHSAQPSERQERADGLDWKRKRDRKKKI